MVARNVTAIVIALLVLLLGVRPLVGAVLKKKDRDDALAAGQPVAAADGMAGISVAPPVSLDQMESGRGFEDRIGAVRGFTRDNPARAALAVRDMIKADGK
jgi:flagellar M-ring protein FliF